MFTPIFEVFLQNGNKNGKCINKKNKAEGMTVLDFKMYYTKLELSKQYGNCLKPHGPLEYNRASGSKLTFLHPTDFQQK